MIATQKYWNNMEDKLSGSEVVIVSYGIRGKNALKELLLRKINVVAICDNNENFRYQNVGVPMFSTEEVTKKYRDAMYVIANKKYSDVLEKQLILLGIPKINIILDTFDKIRS